MASYLRITPEHGVIEIGHIWLGLGLQRTREATEAIYLLARHAFDDLGYRRFEWKCNAANAASRRAAERFGFTFEGIFRQHQIVKGRNRDTAWYAILDHEWPADPRRLRGLARRRELRRGGPSAAPALGAAQPPPRRVTGPATRMPRSGQRRCRV